MLFMTVTGRLIDFNKFKPEDVDIKDIAHGLSFMCRFNGHCKYFYSVAQHSIRVASILPDDHRLQGLLHDASEAYLADIARPVKMHLPDYKILENRVLSCIFERFDLPTKLPDIVKRADDILLRIEMNELMPHCNFPSSLKNIPPIPASAYAKEIFLETFRSEQLCLQARP